MKTGIVDAGTVSGVLDTITRRCVALGMALVLVGALGGALAAGSARAAAGACPESALCLWADAYYEGTRWVYSISQHAQNEWLSVGPGADDKATSDYGNRVHATWLSEEVGASKGWACISPHGAKEDLLKVMWPQNGENVNNTISGFDLTTRSNCEGEPRFAPLPG